MFIVDSPVNCKIFLKYKPTNSSSYQMKELMLTQVFNYKISENKRPIYAFNHMDYQQVARGKRLFEGIIVIKKSIISDISKIVDVGTPNLKSEKKYIDAKIEYLKNVIEQDKSMKSKIDEYKERALDDYNKKLNSYMNNKKYDVINDMPKDASIIIGFGSYLDDNDFKAKYEKITKNSEYSSNDVNSLEKLISEKSDFIVEDVNFFEKTGEINISKNDIDEVYKFFGKLRIGSINREVEMV